MGKCLFPPKAEQGISEISDGQSASHSHDGAGFGEGGSREGNQDELRGPGIKYESPYPVIQVGS